MGKQRPPPIDAAELNAISKTLADDYSKDEILSEETKTALGLSSDATPDKAFLTIVPAGSIYWYAKNDIPDGFLKCDGAAISRTLYARLFSVIGTSFGGGDGNTTFSLPNLQAMFIRGSGAQSGYSATFGVKQFATSIPGYVSKQIILEVYNADKANTAFFDSLSQSSAVSSKQNYSYDVRPYNIALTPIIKY